MYRKQIAYAGLIGLKYLFNLEHEISEQLFIVFVLSVICMKQILIEGAHNFTLQIEEAVTFVTYAIGCMKEQMHSKETYNLQTQNLHI